MCVSGTDHFNGIEYNPYGSRQTRTRSKDRRAAYRPSGRRYLNSLSSTMINVNLESEVRRSGQCRGGFLFRLFRRSRARKEDPMHPRLHEKHEPSVDSAVRPHGSSALRRGGFWAIIALVLATLGPLPAARVAAAAPASPSLKPSVPSGQPVGASVTWTAGSSGLKSPVYRFSVGLAHQPALIVRDYSPSPTFTWTPLREGTYTINTAIKAGFAAIARNGASATFTIASRVKGKNAVVSHTANPLVALYSAPACAKGTMVVQFRPATGGAWQSTAPQPCGGETSINIQVAGMRASTAYVLRHVVSGSTPSAPLSFTTGKPPTGLKITTFTEKQAPTDQADPATPVIFHALIPNLPPTVANPIGTDLSGHLVWYYDSLHSGLTNIWPVRSLPGGAALILGTDRYHPKGDDVLREIDLAGDTVRETNVDIVNAQLTRRGQEIIYMFHHDALRLPNGDTAVLGATQKKYNNQDVMSDMLVVLDPNLQVVWTWDMFTHFTPPATFPASSGICSVLCALPDPKSHDWTHGNAIGWSPVDGDLTLSFRNISSVLKINYQNGRGDGNVVWNLGKGGDFTITSSDPYPWFSKQHNANLVSPTILTVFDDGNVRCNEGKVKGCQSRGQVYKLDQQHHTAALLLNVTLGQFWQALGSAELLPNGNYTFAGGFSPPSREAEFTLKGTKVFELDTPVSEYRAYRLKGMS